MPRRDWSAVALVQDLGESPCLEVHRDEIIDLIRRVRRRDARLAGSASDDFVNDNTTSACITGARLTENAAVQRILAQDKPKRAKRRV